MPWLLKLASSDRLKAFYIPLLLMFPESPRTRLRFLDSRPHLGWRLFCSVAVLAFGFCASQAQTLHVYFTDNSLDTGNIPAKPVAKFPRSDSPPTGAVDAGTITLTPKLKFQTMAGVGAQNQADTPVTLSLEVGGKSIPATLPAHADCALVVMNDPSVTTAVAKRDEVPSPLINSRPTTFCNPLNLDYMLQPDPKIGYREAADPGCIYFHGNYFVIASKSGGYWFSPDFVDWKLVTPPNLPLDEWAPTVFEYKGALFFMTTHDGNIYRSEHPEDANSWTVVGKVRRDQDPALFLDDDGRVYLYYGCHPFGPISGVELDPNNQFAEIGEPVDFLWADLKERGWERGSGENYNGTRPYIEGAWMTKHAGHYYLQYAAPGTQWKLYGDGAAVSDHPLGPFVYADYSPVSFKPRGFLGGAGHSATFTDKDSNLWRIVTAVIGKTHGFERRLALYPQGFDDAGRMFTRTVFGDYPQFLPGQKSHPEKGNAPGWMLLNFGKTVSVSSSLPDHPAAAAADEDIRTWWSAAKTAPGEWISIDLGSEKTIRAVQINFAEQDVVTRSRESGFAQRYLLEYSDDGNAWKILADKRANQRDVPHDYIELLKPLTARYLKVTDAGTPGGGKFSVRDLRVFGTDGGVAPNSIENLSALRNPASRNEVTLSWSPAPGTDGTIIRYGVAPNALWNQYEVRGVHSLTIQSLNATPGYWFAADSFNENGVTTFQGKPIVAP